MRKNQWKAVAVAAVLMMTMPALLALAADKTAKAKPAGKATEQSMPGCSMHGGADKGAAPMAGCGMKGEMGKGAAGNCKPGDMKGCCCCGMKGEMGKGMAGCGMKGEMGKGMAGCGMKGEMGKGMAGCGMKGEMGKGMAGCGMKGEMGNGMAGCGMKGEMGKEMPGCGMKGEMGKEMPGCGMKGEMGKEMPGCGMKGEMGRGMAGGPMGGPGMGAGMGRGMGPGMEPGHVAMVLKALDLTPEQQKKVDAIHERQARLTIQSQADVRIAELDLRQLAHAQTPDKVKIDAQIDRIAQLRAGMAKSHAAALLEVRALLTPEQLKKFHALPMGGEEGED